MLKVIYYLGLFTFLVFNSLVCSSWAAQFTDGLVVYLPFDEGTGQKTKDASGNKHDGILEGPFKWDKGKFGQSLRFTSGKGTWVKVEDTKMLNVDVCTLNVNANVNVNVNVSVSVNDVNVDVDVDVDVKVKAM